MESSATGRAASLGAHAPSLGDSGTLTRQMGLASQLGLLGLLVASSVAAPSQSVLRLNQPVQGRLSGAQRHHFEFHLEGGQYALVIVDQRDADLALDVSAPGGSQTRSFDGFEFGPESASIVATASGNYGITLRAVGRSGTPGRYTITLAEVRIAEPADRDAVNAEDLATAGKSAAASEAADSVSRALDLNRQALALWQTLGNQRATAGTHLKIGEALFAMSDVVAARDEFLVARGSCIELRDHRCSAEAANDAGLCAWKLSKNEEALALLTEALDLWTALRLPYGQAATHNNLGLLSWQTGEWQQAISHYLKALAIFRPRYAREAALAENNLGLDYLSLGDFDKAVSYLDKASVYFHNHSEVVPEGRSLMNMGRAKMFLGDLDAALALQRRALALLEMSPNLSYRADVLNNLGQVLVRKNSFSDAQVVLEQALKVYDSVSDPRGRASALHHLGVTVSSQGNTTAGLTYLSQALDIRKQLNLDDEAAETLFQMARLQERTGQMDKALVGLQTAIDLSESLRTRALGLYFRSSYFATKQPYYEAYIDLLMSLHKASPAAGFDKRAFAASERSRARSLMDTLGEARAGIRAGVDPALLERERELRRRLNLTSNSLLSMGLSGVAAGSQQSLRKQLDDLLGEYEQVEALLRESSPSYSALVMPEPLGPEAIQSQLLDSDTLLLEFFLGGRFSYVWVVSVDSLQAFVLPARTVVEPPVKDALALLGQDRLAAARPSAQHKLQSVLTVLARDLLSSVDDLPRYKRLAIVADGLLQYVPFSALPAQHSLKPGNLSGVPLGLSHEIVMLPSASSVARLREVRSGRPLPPKTIAVFADPVFNSRDPRVHAAVRGPSAPPSLESPNTGLPLARLPFSRLDVASLGQLVAPQGRLIAVDFAASRQTLVSQQMQQFRIIHFSTHAIVDDRQPALSGIALSMVDSRGRPVDGFVRLTDIYNLDSLRAELVVLSACRTALGRQVRGEGVVGLSRAFLYAGASQVLVTLWSVDDEASAEFMKYFYTAMLGPKKQSPSEALRSAELALSASKRWMGDPFYWAGFVLQGDWK